jgi:hypothetical protein
MGARDRHVDREGADTFTLTVFFRAEVKAIAHTCEAVENLGDGAHGMHRRSTYLSAWHDRDFEDRRLNVWASLHARKARARGDACRLHDRLIRIDNGRRRRFDCLRDDVREGRTVEYDGIVLRHRRGRSGRTEIGGIGGDWRRGANAWNYPCARRDRLSRSFGSRTRRRYQGQSSDSGPRSGMRHSVSLGLAGSAMT